ncbi:MAG: helix-turn-helix transcriptional regulator [Eubacteriales bacterium]|nr:helix-turn-helix transcriptional regulator [Eubacteriales bacterium]
MEIFISENLKSYRNKKGNTQDQLADFLGISKQSVSKWERGEGFPDITLLPYIASYYNVTVDDLLGTGEIQKRAAINEYIEKSSIFKRAGDIAADLDLWETAYREYPNEIQVMYYLIVAFANDYKKYADKIIVLGQKILNENSYNIYHYTVIQLLCYTYNTINDKENAMKYAYMLGSYYSTQDQLLIAILKDEQAVRKCQYNIRDLINLIYRNTCGITEKGKYTPTDSIKAYTFVINVFKLVFEQDDFGSYADVLSDLHKRIAECYLNEENIIAALDNLEDMLKYSIIVDTQPDIIHTSPMINLIECNHVNCTKNYLENESGLRLKELKNNIFDSLREEPRFIKIISDLEKYANK